MNCSFVELYNEKLYDLLNPTSTVKLQVLSSFEKVKLAGVVEPEVSHFDECMQYLWQGWNQRQVAETKMNRESSRSHAIFMLTLVTENTENGVVNCRTSRLNLVDLAGSERQGQTNNTGEHLREAGSINKSLSILARVIRNLADEKTNAFIPYRDSILTSILRDSLGGNAKTTVIVNIHPNSQFRCDTISTLHFAENVKKVQNTATVNESVSCKTIEALKAEINRLREENRELKAEQMDVKLNMSVHIDDGLYEENQKYRQQLKEKEETIAKLQSVIKKNEREVLFNLNIA